MKTSIRKIGNSTGTILPSIILKNLKLSNGDLVEITEDGNRIIISPINKKPAYKLKDLLSECDLEAPMPEELTEWDEMPHIGRELV